MKKWILLLITLAAAWYLWHNGYFAEYFPNKKAVSYQSQEEDDDWCEVKRIECGELTRKLNSFRPGRYFEEVEKLLGVSIESMTARREDKNVILLMPNGSKVIHAQSGKEKGFVTVIFRDGYTMKYNKNGKLISAH